MTTNELLNEYTRATCTDAGVLIEAATIDWPHPSVPRLSWKAVGSLPADASAEAVADFRHELLQRPDLFGVCGKCHQGQLRGWLRDEGLCMACA